MTPLFACFPICLTFAALGVLGLLVLATGAYSHAATQPEPIPDVHPADEPGTGFPPWWVVLLIFAAVLSHFALALWLWPEL